MTRSITAPRWSNDGPAADGFEEFVDVDASRSDASEGPSGAAAYTLGFDDADASRIMSAACGSLLISFVDRGV